MTTTSLYGYFFISYRDNLKEVTRLLSSPFFTFSSVFIIAFAMPILALLIPQLRIPTAILEIICGILVGRGGFHLILPPDWMKVVTKIGLLYLMFLAGLEIRIPLKRKKIQPVDTQNTSSSASSKTLVIALVNFLATAALALFAGRLLWQLGLTKNPLLTSLIFATTSLGVVVPILKETELIEKTLGQALLLSSLVADFMTVFLASWVLKSPTRPEGDLGLQMIVLTALGIAIYFTGIFALRIINLKQRIVRVSQLGVRAALAIMAICGTVAMALHAEVILGGFIGGLVYSLLAQDQHEVLRGKLEILGYALFLPMFFVTVGMELDLSHVQFDSVLTNLPIYVLLAFLVKIGSAAAFRPVFTWRETIMGGILMSTRFTLVIAVTTVAAHIKMINGTEEGLLIATAMVTVLLAPFLFNIMSHPRELAQN